VKIEKVVIILCCILLFSASAIAAEQGVVRIQGSIMELDIKKNTMVVIEKIFVWDSNTLFYNEKGSPIKVDQLKTKTYVYIEGEKIKNIIPIMIKKIYLLPKYIGEGEKHLYPFIQQ